jgi:hypothetical protein
MVAVVAFHISMAAQIVRYPIFMSSEGTTLFNKDDPHSIRREHLSSEDLTITSRTPYSCHLSTRIIIERFTDQTAFVPFPAKVSFLHRRTVALSRALGSGFRILFDFADSPCKDVFGIGGFVKKGNVV